MHTRTLPTHGLLRSSRSVCLSETIVVVVSNCGLVVHGDAHSDARFVFSMHVLFMIVVKRCESHCGCAQI